MILSAISGRRRLRALSMLGAAMVGLPVPRAARAEDLGALPLPVARLEMGPAIHFTPKPYTGVQFALDATVGAYVLFGDEGNFAADAELGYAYDHVGTHLFDLHGGLGAGVIAFHVLYQPHFLAGTLDGIGAIGMRNGIGFHVFLDMASLEVAHQFVSSAGTLTHDVHIMIGVNPASIFYVVGKAVSVLNGYR